MALFGKYHNSLTGRAARKVPALAVAAGVLLLGTVSCAVLHREKKLKTIQQGTYEVGLTLPKAREVEFRDINAPKETVSADTIKVTDAAGNEMILMHAIKDEETGEMVANQVLDAAVVTARFRNVAERHGRIDLEFEVRVPQGMMDSEWQLRFNPDMYILEDSLRLDPVIITGKGYRDAQMRGYRRYQRFIDTIVTDTTKFVDLWQLEIFLQRNIPQLYAFKADSTFVSDEEFASAFGVTEREAIDHYTNKFAVRYNNHKKSRMGKMYRKYVKAPIVTEGIRLDTVYTADNGDFVYDYVQTINTRPKLRKVDIVLSGNIYKQDELLYRVPRSAPLTFYISSLSSFLDPTPHYLTKIIERKVEANTACYIEFKVGKADIERSLGRNASEISRIEGNLRDILNNEKFDLDSISIAAYASPEGTVQANSKLSAKRAEATGKYFSSFLKELQDSLKREAGMTLVIDEEGNDSGMQDAFVAQNIKFLSHNGGENWDMLGYLMDIDSLYSDAVKEDYFSIVDKHRDLDVREGVLRKRPFYQDMKKRLYPYCRVVAFDFHMHRKGMVKDTVHTTVLDSTYMAGVEALRDHDYEAALVYLSPYHDYNTAVAYLALDRNISALRILEKLPMTSDIKYMMAVLKSRVGEEQQAVQYYIDCCRDDHKYVARGNLDPEIAALIRKYDLQRIIEPEDDLSEFGF